MRIWDFVTPSTITFLGALIAAAGALWGAHRNAELTRDFQAKAEHIAGSVTGGDSYGYLHPLPHPNGSVGYFLRINAEAKYPVFDTTVRVYDVTSVPAGDPRGVAIHSPESFPTLTGSNQWHYVFDSGQPDVSGARPRTLRVEVAARNGVMVQEIRLAVEDGAWRTNSRKMEWNGRQVPIPKDFPSEKLP